MDDALFAGLQKIFKNVPRFNSMMQDHYKPKQSVFDRRTYANCDYSKMNVNIVMDRKVLNTTHCAEIHDGYLYELTLIKHPNTSKHSTQIYAKMKIELFEKMKDQSTKGTVYPGIIDILLNNDSHEYVMELHVYHFDEERDRDFIQIMDRNKTRDKIVFAGVADVLKPAGLRKIPYTVYPGRGVMGTAATAAGGRGKRVKK